MGHTLVEKMLASQCAGVEALLGQSGNARVDLVLATELAGVVPIAAVEKTGCAVGWLSWKVHSFWRLPAAGRGRGSRCDRSCCSTGPAGRRSRRLNRAPWAPTCGKLALSSPERVLAGTQRGKQQ